VRLSYKESGVITLQKWVFPGVRRMGRGDVGQGEGPRGASRIPSHRLPRPNLYPVYSQFYTRKQEKFANFPPSVNTLYSSIDNGDCRPKYLRATTYAFPQSIDIAKQAGIPLAVIATPFAPLDHDEEEIPLVALNKDPPRCERCKGFINVNIKFLSDGKEWMCNLCGNVNMVPDWYQCGLDPQGRRKVRAMRST
jgi:hypothetical protein